ncbi:MAG: acetolactate synthase [Verrucomicrobiota bacterium]
MPLPTAEKLNSPQVRQFSVFLQNKVGALLEVVKLLNQSHVIVLALSIQDSSESAIGRMIVSDPERVVDLFHEHEIPYSECEMLLVELKEGPGDLSRVLSALLMAEVNVYFSYPLLVRPHDLAVLAMHLDDNECASSVLAGEGFKLLTQGDLSR